MGTALFVCFNVCGSIYVYRCRALLVIGCTCIYAYNLAQVHLQIRSLLRTVCILLECILAIFKLFKHVNQRCSFLTEKSARCSRVFIVDKLVVSRTQCIDVIIVHQKFSQKKTKKAFQWEAYRPVVDQKGGFSLTAPLYAPPTVLHSTTLLHAPLPSWTE